MSEFDISHAVQLYTNGQSISNNLWTIYVAVVSALLILMFGEHKKDLKAHVIVTCVFVMFIIINISPIYNIQGVLYETTNAIHKVSQCSSSNSEYSRVFCSVKAPSAHTVLYFHLFLDLIVLVAIWYRIVADKFISKKT